MKTQSLSTPAQSGNRTSPDPGHPARTLETTAAGLTDLLLAAGIRINPADPDPWDISVHDLPRFARRVLSPSSNGLTELGDMYVEGIWDCDDISEFSVRCLNSGLNARFG